MKNKKKKREREREKEKEKESNMNDPDDNSEDEDDDLIDFDYDDDGNNEFPSPMEFDSIDILHYITDDFMVGVMSKDCFRRVNNQYNLSLRFCLDCG